MYPGQGNHNYGRPPVYGQPPSFPPANGYGYNNAPPPPPSYFNGPPAQSSSYGGTPLPPPSQFNRPPGPPPAGVASYNRPPPSSFPAGHSSTTHAPHASYASHASSYSRPPGPPPGVAAQQHMGNHSYNYTNPNNGQTFSFQRPKDLPTQQQSFGQGTNLTFKYSNCSGRKKALLIGCNYAGQGNRIELKGCINDVHNMKLFITQRYGYSADDIVVLTDDQQQMARVPTKANMIRAMQWLVKDARPNDSLFFHFSGHGGVTEDEDGDEEDGFDNTIYPADFRQNGVIVDDLMHDIMVKNLPAGCRLTALFDSCHSGTALDLPYIYSTKGVVKEPNLLKDLGQDGVAALSAYAAGNIQATIKSVTSIFDKVSRNKSKEDRDRIRSLKASAADVISISGCKDDQTSADANINGSATGAMSYAFKTVLTNQPVQSYISLLNNMRAQLSGRYSQKPQLSASHPIDVNIQFIL